MRHSHLIIFDLDDTLVDTSEVFYRSRSCFERLMTERGIDSDCAVRVFEEIDGINFGQFGVSPQRYRATMTAACERLLEMTEISLDQQLAEDIHDCAAIINVVYPQLITGAHELLAWARSRFELAMLTRGKEQLQTAKIDFAELRQYFSTIDIVEKKTAARFASIMAACGYAPQDCWVVGDSIKSDINPGLAAGAKCIWYEHKHPYYRWHQEHSESANGKHVSPESLAEVRRVLEDSTK